jgi:subtilisin family serine protease
LTNTNSLALALLHLLVLIVAAAGNSGNSALGFPASYPSVMSVASLTSSGSRSSFSQYNDQVEISAPGSDVKSTVPGNNYDTYSGTSMVSLLFSFLAYFLFFLNATSNRCTSASAFEYNRLVLMWRAWQLSSGHTFLNARTTKFVMR